MPAIGTAAAVPKSLYKPASPVNLPQIKPVQPAKPAKPKKSINKLSSPNPKHRFIRPHAGSPVKPLRVPVIANQQKKPPLVPVPHTKPKIAEYIKPIAKPIAKTYCKNRETN